MLRDVATDQQMSGLTTTLTIDRDQAARFGVQPQVIDDTLYDAFGQRQITQYFSQVNSYHLILEVMPDQVSDVETLNKLYVKSSTGQAVPLSTFVKWSTVPVQPLSISHQSQFPAVTISFNLAHGAALGQAVDAINAAVRQMGVPITVQGTFQGTAQAFQSSLSTQPYLIAAALITVYIILGILYESYILPLTILSTLPSAGVGALLMLMAMKYDLSVIALIGVILLIGIVKKNGIMMVDFAITAERRDGETPLNAIRQACLLRFRPIMMTTMAAMLSGLPLMLGHGAGSELRRPLGHRHGRRAAAQSGADAVHHAGDLSVSRSPAALAGATAPQHADAGREDGIGGRGLTADHSGRPALRRPSMNRSNSMLSMYESNRRMSPMLA